MDVGIRGIITPPEPCCALRPTLASITRGLFTAHEVRTEDLMFTKKYLSHPRLCLIFEKSRDPLFESHALRVGF